MTQYNSLIVKLLGSHLNELKSPKKNKTEVISRLSSNMIDNCDDEINFPYTLLLIDKSLKIFCK